MAATDDTMCPSPLTNQIDIRKTYELAHIQSYNGVNGPSKFKNPSFRWREKQRCITDGVKRSCFYRFFLIKET